MVGGRSREPPSQYCRPGELAIANPQTHHEVNHELSRRLVKECGIPSHSHRTGRNCECLSRSTSASARGGSSNQYNAAPEEMRREQKIEIEAPWSEVTARDIVAEVDELSWRCGKRSPFHKTSAWIFCAGSNRQVAHPSHSMRAQLGFLREVTPAPRTSEPFDEPSARIFCAG